MFMAARYLPSGDHRGLYLFRESGTMVDFIEVRSKRRRSRPSGKRDPYAIVRLSGDQVGSSPPTTKSIGPPPSVLTVKSRCWNELRSICPRSPAAISTKTMNFPSGDHLGLMTATREVKPNGPYILFPCLIPAQKNPACKCRASKRRRLTTRDSQPGTVYR